MSAIDRAEVERIARLSRLELEGERLDAMTKHMANMLGFVSALDEFDRKDAPLRAHGGEGAVAPLRADEVRPSLSVAEALANAPEKGEKGFRVPAVIE
jgi:aspartyl-tRNA(Asn)/glutamyl-tRNA(Gln) amidotransferase subunit C